jgi:alcohol dehydrogenase (cytochrome c)
MTGSYDPALNLTYWGIGNPGPDWNGDLRLGDNLYSDCVVALDVDTGKLKWYYQFTPHDDFDYDSVQVPVLADISWRGRDGQTSTRKVMLWANRNGFFYVLDRSSGQFLLGKPFTTVTWANGFDEKGRPMRTPGMLPTAEGKQVYPGVTGGTNWYSPSFSPNTGLFYIPTWDNYSAVFQKAPDEYVEGRWYAGGVPKAAVGIRADSVNLKKEDEGYGSVRAVDPQTGQKKWEFKMNDMIDSGILTTASNVLFTGNREGYFFALDARDGRMLWKSSVGGPVFSGPMTYSLSGRQYVAVSAGSALFVYALRE